MRLLFGVLCLWLLPILLPPTLQGAVLGAACQKNSLQHAIIESLLPPELVHKVDPEALSAIFMHPLLQNALNILKSLDESPLSFSQMLHHTDKKIACAAMFVRQFCLFSLYSNPALTQMAGFTPTPQFTKLTDQAYPDSHIQRHDDVITFDGKDVDYLIIGAGPAGSVIASELSKKNNIRVLLIDAGPFVKSGCTKTEYNSAYMESFNQRKTITGEISIRNGRVVGGGTTVNLDLAFSPLLPSIKNNVNRWIQQKRLPYDFVHKSGNDFKILAHAYAWVKQTLGTRSLNADEVNANNKLLLNGCPSAKLYDLNAKKYAGNPSAAQSEPLKISAVDAYLWPALMLRSKNLQVVPNLNIVESKKNKNTITEIIVKPSPSVENECTFNDPHALQLNSTKTYKIKAKNIILCAGTLGSAEILLRSNMPNSNIGKGVILHPSIGALGVFDKPIHNTEGIQATVYAPSTPLSDTYFYEAMSAEPDFIASIHPGTPQHIADNLKDFQNIGGFGIMLVDTVSNDNCVFIDDNGDVQVDYTLSKKDKKRFKKAILNAIKILFKQGAKEVFIPSMEFIYKSDLNRRFTSYKQAVSSIGMLQFNNLTLLSSGHMQGSNKLGDNPKTSVVSPNFKLWNEASAEEFTNLYVMDSSIFPTSVGANPMQSIYTFAKIFVDRLAAK